MSLPIPAHEILSSISYITSRSSGPGGQHVNKTNSRVTLQWKVEEQAGFTEEQKAKIFHKLRQYINSEGLLQISVQESRSQIQNKALAEKRLLQLLRECFRPQKKRIPTQPGKAAVQKRLTSKKLHADKKKIRMSKGNWETDS